MKQPGVMQPHKGLRAVAIFEFCKGTVVLLFGLGALSLVHRDVKHVAEVILQKLHLDPAWHYSQKLLEKAGNVHDVELRRLAVMAFCYAAFRYLQAYGLWTERRWAEWLTVVTAGLFIPLEVQHLFHRFTPTGLCVLLGNLLIVAYVAYILVQNRRLRNRHEQQKLPAEKPN